MSHKLSARYFGPYPIEEKVGHVAYQVRLPEGVKIHNVFHISQLKKKLGNKEVSASWPQFLQSNEEIEKKPVAILDRKLVKRFNRADVKVLVHWSHSSPEEATWEFYHDLQKKFSDFCSLNP